MKTVHLGWEESCLEKVSLPSQEPGEGKEQPEQHGLPGWTSPFGRSQRWELREELTQVRGGQRW